MRPGRGYRQRGVRVGQQHLELQVEVVFVALSVEAFAEALLQRRKIALRVLHVGHHCVHVRQRLLQAHCLKHAGRLLDGRQHLLVKLAVLECVEVVL